MFDFIKAVVNVIVTIVTGSGNSSSGSGGGDGGGGGASGSSSSATKEPADLVSGVHTPATRLTWFACFAGNMPFITGTSAVFGLFAFVLSYVDCIATVTAPTLGAALLFCLGPAALFGLVVAGVWFSFATLVNAVNCLLATG